MEIYKDVHLQIIQTMFDDFFVLYRNSSVEPTLHLEIKNSNIILSVPSSTHLKINIGKTDDNIEYYHKAYNYTLTKYIEEYSTVGSVDGVTNAYAEVAVDTFIKVIITDDYLTFIGNTMSITFIANKAELVNFDRGERELIDVNKDKLMIITNYMSQSTVFQKKFPQSATVNFLSEIVHLSFPNIVYQFESPGDLVTGMSIDTVKTLRHFLTTSTSLKVYKLIDCYEFIFDNYRRVLIPIYYSVPLKKYNFAEFYAVGEYDLELVRKLNNFKTSCVSNTFVSVCIRHNRLDLNYLNPSNLNTIQSSSRLLSTFMEEEIFFKIDLESFCAMIKNKGVMSMTEKGGILCTEEITGVTAYTFLV